MDCMYRPFDEGHLFSKTDTAFQSRMPLLAELSAYEPDLEGLLSAADDRADYPVDRDLLCDVLADQYKAIGAAHMMDRIGSLSSPATFTLVTAHQPGLFLGPLYIVYKIVSVIRLAEALEAADPAGRRFQPVFIIGGEDHDFEEINHIHLFGQRLTWETAQAGPCGRFAVTDMAGLQEQLFALLGDKPAAAHLKDVITDCYREGRSYAEATQAFVHHWFGARGLLVLNMDDPRFKERMKDVFRRELTEQLSQALIRPVQQQLATGGFKPATFLREVNLFHMTEQVRERIEWDGAVYTLHQTGRRFSPAEMLEELDDHPERFSPNVNLRPVYQETILPNIAYIGGGGEIAYWLERKEQFRELGVFYPVLVRRDSAIWIDSTVSRKMEKLGLDIPAVYKDTDVLINEYLKDQQPELMDISADSAVISEAMDAIVAKGSAADATLRGAFEAEKVRILKSLEQMEGRIRRAEKQKHDVAVNQIRQVREKLFPEGQLQERYDNFMSYYVQYGDAFLDALYTYFDPLRRELRIIRDAG